MTSAEHLIPGDITLNLKSRLPAPTISGAGQGGLGGTARYLRSETSIHRARVPAYCRG